MLPLLQPHRPQAPPPFSQAQPNAQQIRAFSNTKPQSQIQAMPPTITPPPKLFDPALRLPVFFTAAAQRRLAPSLTPRSWPAEAVNPVAMGYAFPTNGSNAKL